MNSDKQTPVLVYVAGWGRSGSTLLDRLMGELPNVVSLGELALLPVRGVLANELCGCGVRFAQCPFWSRVAEDLGGWEPKYGKEMDALRHQVARARHQLTTGISMQLRGRRRLLDDYVSRYMQLSRSVARTAGADVLIDSSKHPTVARALMSDKTADIRIAHIVRDPRGVAYSWSKVKQRPEAGEDAGEEMARFSAVSSSVRWVLLNWLTSLLRHQTPYYSVVRYEDLVDDPTATISRLLHNLGLSERGSVKVSASREIAFGVHHTVAGNPSRLRAGKTSIHADEEWRKNMQPSQQRMVSALTFMMRSRYGYTD